MNHIIKFFLIAGVLIIGILGMAYYAFMQIDFIGEKDSKIVEENLKRWNNTLLSAEYRNETEFCKVEILDSINIQINVGDKSGQIILNQKYKMSSDTIVVIGGIEHVSEYLNSNKFLIQKNNLLFNIDSHGNFDSITKMTIKFNKLKL